MVEEINYTPKYHIYKKFDSNNGKFFINYPKHLIAHVMIKSSIVPYKMTINDITYEKDVLQVLCVSVSPGRYMLPTPQPYYYGPLTVECYDCNAELIINFIFIQTHYKLCDIPKILQSSFNACFVGNDKCTIETSYHINYILIYPTVDNIKIMSGGTIIFAGNSTFLTHDTPALHNFALPLGAMYVHIGGVLQNMTVIFDKKYDYSINVIANCIEINDAFIYFVTNLN